MTVIAAIGPERATSTVTLDGDGAVLAALARRVRRAGVDVQTRETARGHLTVVEGVAPQPNYLGVMAAGDTCRVYCTRGTLDYVAALVCEYAAAGATGLRVRQPVLNEWAVVGSRSRLRRRLRKFDHIDFDWDTEESVDADVFDADVTFHADGEQTIARIRVAGHLDPSDGRFHWAGTVYGPDVRRWRDEKIRSVEIVTAAGQVAQARLTDITPWGTVRVVGEGEQPR